MPVTDKIRRVLPFLSLAVLIVVIYDGWVFYSRHRRVQEIQQNRAEKEAADAQRTLELIGQLKILSFYAVPPAIRPGATTRLCYSVVDAKNVRIEPEVKGVYPALSHCVEVTPKKDTEYTLFAQDGAGHTVSQKIEIQVRH